MTAATRGSLTAAYGGQLAHFSPLTRDRERELALRWKQHGDSAAADELVKAHLRYVVATAVKFRRYGIPLDELIAEGSFGVVHALGKFDPERGTRFVTYAAYWIRAYILNYVLRSWSLVGSGAGALRSKNFFRLRRERARIFNLFTDETAAEEELAKRLEVPLPQLKSMLERLDTRDVSLDSQVFEGSGSRLVDTLVADERDQEASLVDDQARDHRVEAVRSAVVKLDDRERFIVESRMMADRDDELSLAEIGRRLGVSRERARQLEVRAKGKLRALLSNDAQRSDVMTSVPEAAPAPRRANENEKRGAETSAAPPNYLHEGSSFGAEAANVDGAAGESRAPARRCA